jgi:hypothetical protein
LITAITCTRVISLLFKFAGSEEVSKLKANNFRLNLILFELRTINIIFYKSLKRIDNMEQWTSEPTVTQKTSGIEPAAAVVSGGAKPPLKMFKPNLDSMKEARKLAVVKLS